MKMKLIAAAVMATTSLSALALTPGAGSWAKESATYGAPNLQDAYVYVPANANPAVQNGKRALMLTLHGCGQTASGNVINKKFNWETTAEKYGMVVVAPTVPSGSSATRSNAGCWDWFGTGWTRTNRDQVPLKKLLDSVMARTNLDIDPNQVYVTGLSSGAAETHVLGCVFPDLFAGVGVNAAPALGSGSMDIFSEPKLSVDQIISNCQAGNGGNYNGSYATQVWNTVYGSTDSMVKPSHNPRNADAMAKMYGASKASSTFSVAGGGTGTVYLDAAGKERVTSIVVNGMGHAWPAGSGGSGGGTYVDYSHMNYPEWVTAWFFATNLRAGSGGGTTGGTTDGTTGGTTNGGTTTGGTTTGGTTTGGTTGGFTLPTLGTGTLPSFPSTGSTTGYCAYANNISHVLSGRAYLSMGKVYALGSNQSMGSYSSTTMSKLRQMSALKFVVDSSCQ